MPVIEVIPAHRIQLIGGKKLVDADTIIRQQSLQSNPMPWTEVARHPPMRESLLEHSPGADIRRISITQASSARRKNCHETAADPQVPALRLQGKWLEQAGFSIGRTVRIEIRDGLLVIRPEAN